MVEQQYQTFGRRAGAYLLDRLPFYGLQQIGGLFSSYFASFYFGLAWGQLWGWAWIVYRVLAHGFWGQTLGKKICKVKVVALSRQRLSMKQAFLREVVPIVLDLASLVYVILNVDAYERMVVGGEPNSRLATAGTVYFWAMNLWWLAQIIAVHLNDRRRAIHDYIAGSVVLRLDTQEIRGGNWLSSIRGLGRPGMATIAAILAAIAALALPALSYDGEICPGFPIEPSEYYLRLLPATLLAAALGAVLGGLTASGEIGGRKGCAVAAVVAGLVGCVLFNLLLASGGLPPGC